jgi:hypothetical protein
MFSTCLSLISSFPISGAGSSFASCISGAMARIRRSASSAQIVIAFHKPGPLGNFSIFSGVGLKIAAKSSTVTTG